jgi:hypothetical protein
VKKGAIFVNAVRDLADEAGIDLGFKRPETVSVGAAASTTIQGEFFASAPSPATPSPTMGEATIEEAIWSETLSQLQGQMTRAAFSSLMQGTRLVGQEGEAFVVVVTTGLAKEWLENRWRQVVERALSNVIGSPATVEFRL